MSENYHEKFDLKGLLESDWFKSRPKSVQEAIRKYPPNLIYEIESGHIAYIVSYTEGKKSQCKECVVNVIREYNPHIEFSRRVFGISLKELKPVEKLKTNDCVLCERDVCHSCLLNFRDRGGCLCLRCFELRHPELKYMKREPVIPDESPVS